MRTWSPRTCPVVPLGVAMLLAASAIAQQTDVTLTPNAENAGIRKSLEEQIGAGRGDVFTPGSSIFIIKRDPFRSVRRGRQLFQRKFTHAQGQGPRINDGEGDIGVLPRLGAGLMDSCAGCHARPEGSAGSGGAVFSRPDSRDAPHLFGLGLREMLADEITQDLRSIRTSAITAANSSGAPVTMVLTSKEINYGTITAFPNGTVDNSGLQGVDPDLRVKPFFAEGREFSMRAFAVGAFEEEMGLPPFDLDLLAASQGAVVVTPSGLVLDGSVDQIAAPLAQSAKDDPDGDGVKDEIPVALIDHMEFYLLHYFKPGLYKQTAQTARGRRTFERIQCTTCHIPDLPINNDRRVADVETVYDPVNGIFNTLFATASASFTVLNDSSGFPPIKEPAGQPFLVRNLFTDFKRHDLGPRFHERRFDGTLTTKFMTRALWGVGTTAPYGHDGRSINLEEVILRHGEEAQVQRDAFATLSPNQQADLIAFLNALILFPPDSTASDLDPGNPNTPGFPQKGHGSIKLTVLFNDPSDVE